MTEEQYKALIKSDDECLHGIAELKTQIALIVRLLNGSPDEDIPGVRPRLVMVERRMTDIPTNLAAILSEMRDDNKKLTDEQTKWKERYNGAKWVLGILGVTNAATLGVLARFLMGGP